MTANYAATTSTAATAAATTTSAVAHLRAGLWQHKDRGEGGHSQSITRAHAALSNNSISMFPHAKSRAHYPWSMEYQRMSAFASVRT